MTIFQCVLIALGVHSIQVALLSEMATVEFDEDLTDADTLTKEISSLGFDVKLISVTTKTEVSTAKFKVCMYVLYMSAYHHRAENIYTL